MTQAEQGKDEVVDVETKVPFSEKEIEEKCRSKHYEMIHQYVTTGMSCRELGNMYDISEAHVQHMKRTSLWKNEEELLRASMRDENQVKIELLVPTAIDTIQDVMEDRMNSPTARVNAAGKALEIAEYGKAKPEGGVGGRNVTLNLTRPGWDKGGEGKGDTINIQVNVD